MDQLYDIAIVGGGLAGSALAKSMAEKGFRVVASLLEGSCALNAELRAPGIFR
jgi:flavin-dependent dehydrogenase